MAVVTRELVSEKARLDSAELARMYARFERGIISPQDAFRLWGELDAVRFELSAANERTRIAREERDSLQDQLYQVRAQLPRKAGPI